MELDRIPAGQRLSCRSGLSKGQRSVLNRSHALCTHAQDMWVRPLLAPRRRRRRVSRSAFAGKLDTVGTYPLVLVTVDREVMPGRPETRRPNTGERVLAS